MKAFLRSLTLVAALCVGWAANAQSLADYTYATGVDATKWVTITDSTNLLGTGNADGRASSLQNIGFTFPFGEDVYTQFSVNSDGNLRLGSTVTGTSAYSTPFNTNANSNNPKINFLGCDGYFLDTIHYVYTENTVDANNDSMLCVEFCLGTFTSSTRAQKYKWQVHMYPSGKIEVIMASTAPNTAPAAANQKGLCVNSQDGWIIDSDNFATHFTSGSTVTWPSGSWPAPSTYYTFTRPVITCPRPAAITVSNITTTTATVSFTPSGNETEWIGTINPGIMGMTTITLNDTVANLILLAPNTEYTVSVRAICGVGDTSSEKTATFRTLCSALTALDLPYTEDFEAYGTGSSNPISPCWTKGTNSSTAYPYPYSTAAINGTRGLYFYSYKPSSATGNSYYCYAALPQLSSSLDITGLTLRFNSKRYTTTSATYRSLIEVGVMSDPTDITTFELVQLVNMTSLPASTIQSNEIDFANYTGTGKYIAFYAPVVDTDDGAAYNYIYIDDVQLITTPTCYRPTDVVVTNASLSSATITWTPADSTTTNFVVAYAPAGDGPSVMSYDTVIGTTATLTGLSQATFYNVYVKAMCSPTDQSEWSLPVSFSTIMIPTPILTHMPYTETFESPSTWLLANDNTNKWVVGEAIAGGGTKALYISNDGGVSNAYTVSGTQWSYAIKTFSFLSSNVAFAFDWKATGESNYDYLRAFLVPVTEEFFGGVSPNGAAPYSFRNTNPEGWIPLDGGSKLNLSSSNWMTQMDTVTFDSTNTYNLVFIWANDASGGAQPPVAIDNLSITVVLDNPCVAPSNLTVTDMTDTSAVVYWTPDESSLSYYGLKITDPTQTYYFSTADTFFSFSGLTPNTTYSVSVLSFCDTVNAVTSEYTSPVIFTTPSASCAPIVVDANNPFYETFDTTSVTLECWNEESRDGGPSWIVNNHSNSGSFNAYSGDAYFFNGRSGNGYGTLYTPVLDLTGSDYATLDFVYINPQWAGDQNVLTVLYRNSDTAAWDTLDTYNTSVTDWTPVSLTIPTVSSTLQIAFDAYNAYGYCIAIDSMVVSAPASYCEPNPTSRDGQGITNVTFGVGDEIVNNNQYPSSAPFYGDYHDMVGAVPAGNTVNLNITYSTGYTYGTIVWVDWNNSRTFDSNEVVFVGTSPSNDPTVFYAGFMIPSSQPSGVYRMRIAGADSYFDSYTGSIEAAAGADPCFTSSWSVAHDYSLHVLPAASCADPYNVSVVSVTPTSATITWDADSTQTNFEVRYTVADSIAYTNFNVLGNTTTIYGLQPETYYNVAVKAVCSVSDQSNWSQNATFYTGYCQPNPTSCDNLGISNVTFGTGTEVVNNSQRPTSSPYYGNYHDMVGAAYAGSMLNLNITYATGYTYGTVIWVDWDNSLTFDGDEVVYVGTAPSTNPTVLNAGFVVPGSQDTGVYRMRIAGADSYFDSYTGSIEAAANANPCFTSSYAVVHDYSLHVMPQAGCADPYGVTVSNITAHTATVSWTPADSTQTSFRVRYAIDSLSTYYVTVSGTSTTLTGLYANTTYTVDVMAVCSSTDQSNWSTATTFSTACDAIAVTTANPYYETFDNTSSTLNCWQNTGSKWFIGSSASGGHSAYSGTSAFANGTGSGSDILLSPIFDISGYESAVLSFVYINPVWSGDQNELTVSYRNSADSAWNILGVYDYNVGSWTPVSLVIPSPSSTTQIAFNFADDYGYCVGIDSLVLAPVSTYDITIGVSDVTMGTTIPTPGTYAYNPGDTLTITALAASHRHFVQWNDGDTHAVRTIVVSGNATYTAEFDYDSVTIIFANADTAMGTITPVPGVYIYHVGDTINAQAVANTGYHFANWHTSIGTLLDSISSNPLEYVIPAFMAGVEMTIAPNFVANMYTINVYANDNTLGNVTGTGNYAYNTTVTITATPAAYCTFVEWNDGNTDHVRTILVTGNASYTATFQAIPQHNVTVHVAPEANMGTVSGTGLYYENSTVTLTATPNDGYLFVGWAYEAFGAFEWWIFSTEPTYSFTMDTADVEFYAVFEPVPQPATLTVHFDSYAGRILINDVETNTYLGHIGDNVTIQAVAYNGFRFIGWSINGNVFSTDATITRMLTEAETEISAIFEQAVGIDDVNASNIIIFSTNNNIIVRGAAQQTIRVYDLVGRLVAQRTGSDIEETIAMPASGVYLVQVGNETARRVVVRR